MALDDFEQDDLLLSRGIVRTSTGDYLEVPLTSIQFWRNRDPDPLPAFEQVAPQAPDPEEGVGFADYARSIMAGGAQLAQGVGWVTRMAGAEEVGRAIEELGANAVDYWNDGLSDPAKDALSREFVRKNEGGEWEWGDANLHTVGLFGAQSLLGTAAGAGAGAGVTKILQTFANPFGRAALTDAVAKGATALPAAAAGDVAAQTTVRTAAAAAKKLKLVDKILGASGFGLGEGAIGGITSGVDVYKSVLNLPAEKLLQNDRYQQVFASTDETMPELERHQYAAETVAREASSLAGLQAGLTTALLGAPMGAFFGSILGKKALGQLAQTTPRAIATGAAGEAAQEFAQGAAETMISNRQRAIAGDDVKLFEGVLNQAIGGALAGAPLGGALGAMDVQRPAKTVKNDVKRDKTEKPGPRLDPLRTVAVDAFKAGVPQEEILETVDRVKKGEEPVLVAVGKLRKRQMGFAGAQSATDFSATQERLAEEQAIDLAEEQGIAKAEQELKQRPAPRTLIDAIAGGETTVTGEKPLRAQFQLVDVNTLVTSHDAEGRANAAFPQELQPRDRSRSASRQWIEETTAKFQHEPMIEGVEAGSGPPIVDADGIVESGNGRVNLLRNVYAKGKGAGYKAYLKAHAARFGLDPAAVEKMETPILVRARQDPLSIEERIEFTQSANRPTVAAMSPSERARADAQMLDDDQLARLNVPDDGNVLAGSNAEFVGRFLQELPATERGGLLTAEGQPTKQVADRIKAALFAKAYDERLLALMAEEADPDVANVVNALVKAAPAFAKVRDGGWHMVGPLVEGVGVVRAARRNGQAVDEYLRQQGLFSNTSPEAGRVASFLSKNIRSAKRMSEALIEIAKYAEAASNPTGDLLGDPLPNTFEAALNAATARMSERYPDKAAAQPDMFGLGRQRPAPAPEAQKKTAPPIDITRDASLSDEEKAIEARLAQKLESDPVAAEQEYAQLDGTMGGKVLNTDLARELSPDYLSDRKKSLAVHEPASSMVKWLYARRLAEAPKANEVPEVLFTAGGTGAGKTTGITAAAEVDPDVLRAQIIFDTNMNGVASSIQKIEQALRSGKTVKIVYTYREPVDALVNGALPRAAKQAKKFGSGRAVPLQAHADTHVGARQAMDELLQRYKDEPRVQLRAIDNSLGAGNARLVPLERIPQLEYDQTLRALHEALDGQLAEGRIDEGVYRAFGGQRQAAEEERVDRDQDRARDRQSPQSSRRQGRAKPAAVAPSVEQVQEGQKGGERYRTDKRVKKYLLAKRPRSNETDRIVNYRTESVLAVREAMNDGADPDVVAFLKTEHEWALERLEEQLPEIDWRNTLQRKEPALDDPGGPELEDLQEFEADEEGVVRDLPLFSRGAAPGGQLASAVRAKLADAIAEVSPLVKVTIAQSPAEYGFAKNVEGAFVDGFGVALFADMLPPGRELEVFVHEVFGHLAMERTPFGKEAVDMVLALHDKKHASIEPLWDEVGIRWGMHLDRETRAKEVIAVMAERGDKHALLTRLIAGVRRFLRKIGIVRDYSDAEVRDLIARSARALRADVAAVRELAKNPKLAALNPSSSDAAILAAIDEAIPADVVALDAHLSRVFHGSPHEFDTFSLEKIGTGEGVQAFGWGLYFAENEQVANSYRRAGLGSPLALNGKPFSWLMPEDVEHLSPSTRRVLALLRDEESMADALRNISSGIYDDFGQGFGAEAQRLIDSGAVTERTQGPLYTAEIPDEEVANFLDWDAPLSKQAEVVRRALAKLHPDLYGEQAEDFELDLNEPGEMTYQRLADLHGGPRGASMALRSEGVNGLKYFDEGSRIKRAGTRNLVVFDESIIKSSSRVMLSRAATADPQIQAIIDRVLTKAPEEFTLKDRVRSIWSDIANTEGLAVKQGLIDSFASIEALERDFTGGQLLDASQSAYKAMLATKNLPSVMAAVMMNGVPEFKGGAYVPVAGRKGIIDIFKPLTEHKDGNLLRQWELFAAANRANRLIKEKNPDGTRRENLFTQAEIDAALTLEQKYPEFRQVLNDWNTFNKQMLDLAQDAGLIDATSRAVWEKNDYVPFYRAVDEFQGPRNRRGVAGQRADIKTLKGQDKALGNVFENMMMNTAHLLDASFKNRAMQRVVGLAVGNALQPVPFAAEAIEVTDDQLARALTKAGLIVGNPVTGLGGIQVVHAMTPQQKAHWSTIFRRVAPKGPNIVSVMQNGKPEYYEVTDPLVLSSITGMGYDNFADIWGLFRGSKKLLTSAVTADPAFMLANWVRDTLSTWVVSDASMHPFIDAIRGAKAALTKDPALLQMMMAGAGGGGFYDANPEDIRKLIATKVPTGTKGFTDSIVDTPAKAWQLWRKIGSAAENANRIAVFRAVLAKGGTVAEAAYQARDVLNFSMSGDYAAMRWLTQTVPFLNARVQGLYRLFRGARDNKKAFFLKGMTLLAATMALALKNNDDERYEELPEWEKDLYWHFFIDDKHFRLPKPFEVGAMFATVPERVWRAATGRDSAKVLWQQIFQMAADTFAFNPVPQLVKPIIEQYANRSMFTGSPIVGMSEQNLDPEAQFTPWTSETMRALADAMPDFVPKWLRSPARLEAALRAYTGSMGMYVLDVSDAMVREALGYPEAPGRKLHDIPVVKRFLASPSPRHTKYADLMYEMLDEANATYSTINRFRREQRFEEATELQRENKSKLAVRVRLNRLSTQVRNINTQIRRIQLDRTISGKDKRARIDALVDRKNKITRQVAPWADLF